LFYRASFRKTASHFSGRTLETPDAKAATANECPLGFHCFSEKFFSQNREVHFRERCLGQRRPFWYTADIPLLLHARREAINRGPYETVHAASADRITACRVNEAEFIPARS
jgi:hypothetical protein